VVVTSKETQAMAQNLQSHSLKTKQ